MPDTRSGASMVFSAAKRRPNMREQVEALDPHPSLAGRTSLTMPLGDAGTRRAIAEHVT